MSGLQTNLMEGVAALLATAHAGVYRSGTEYTVNETGIVLEDMPESPDRVIALSAYPVQDDPRLPNSIIGLQVRTRWGGKDPRPVADLDDAVFAILENYSGTLTTGVKVGGCQRISGASLGQDEGGRRSRSSNYYVSAYWPTSNRR